MRCFPRIFCVSFFLALLWVMAPAWAQPVGDGFQAGRIAHQKHIEAMREQWIQDYQTAKPQREQTAKAVVQTQKETLERTRRDREEWAKDWAAQAPMREQIRKKQDEGRKAHQAVIDANRVKWLGEGKINP